MPTEKHNLEKEKQIYDLEGDDIKPFNFSINRTCIPASCKLHIKQHLF